MKIKFTEDFNLNGPSICLGAIFALTLEVIILTLIHLFGGN